MVAKKIIEQENKINFQSLTKVDCGARPSLVHSFSRRTAHGKRLCFFHLFLFSFLLFPPRFLALNAIGEYFQCDMGFSLFIYQKGNSCTRLNHLLPIILCLLGKKMQEKRNFNAKFSYSSAESRVSFNYFFKFKKGRGQNFPETKRGVQSRVRVTVKLHEFQTTPKTLTIRSDVPTAPSRTRMRALVSSHIFLISSPLRPIMLPTLSTGTISRNTQSPGHPGHFFSEAGAGASVSGAAVDSDSRFSDGACSDSAAAALLAERGVSDSSVFGSDPGDCAAPFTGAGSVVPVVAIRERGEKSSRARGRDCYIGFRVRGCARAVPTVRIFVIIIIII